LRMSGQCTHWPNGQSPPAACFWRNGLIRLRTRQQHAPVSGGRVASWWCCRPGLGRTFERCEDSFNARIDFIGRLVAPHDDASPVQDKERPRAPAHLRTVDAVRTRDGALGFEVREQGKLETELARKLLVGPDPI